MWVAAQITLTVAVLLICCFYFGKKIGERKFYKVQEETKAAEKSFNDLLEQIDLISNHNIKVLQSMTGELQELITIADKKCLYANDLLEEIDKSKSDLHSKFTTSNIASISAARKTAPDPRIDELSETTSLLRKRLDDVETKSASFEKRWQSLVDVIESSPVFNPPREPQKPRQSMPKPLPIKPEEKPAIETVSFALGSKIPKKTDLAREDDLSLMPELQPGTPFYDVLKLSRDGVTVPQIARRMKMATGEVELIMNIYGSRQNLRKVI